MEKKYSRPSIKVFELKSDEQILAGTQIGKTKPTEGLDEEQPGFGGESDGSKDVGAKKNTFSVWTDN